MIIEIGRLTRDVEVRTVQVNGEEKNVLNNRLAVRFGRGESAFIDLTAWNGTADFIGAHFKKGDEMYVEGELRNRVSKIGDRDLSVPFLLVRRIQFTHGNLREDTV